MNYELRKSITNELITNKDEIMKSENVIQEKSYAFAVRIVKLYKYLVDEKKEYVLSKQLLRCGTSLGANIEEAIGGQSDFFLLNLQLHTKKQEKLITGFVY